MRVFGTNFFESGLRRLSFNKIYLKMSSAVAHLYGPPYLKKKATLCMNGAVGSIILVDTLFSERHCPRYTWNLWLQTMSLYADMIVVYDYPEIKWWKSSPRRLLIVNIRHCCVSRMYTPSYKWPLRHDARVAHVTGQIFLWRSVTNYCRTFYLILSPWLATCRHH